MLNFKNLTADQRVAITELQIANLESRLAGETSVVYDEIVPAAIRTGKSGVQYAIFPNSVDAAYKIPDIEAEIESIADQQRGAGFEPVEYTGVQIVAECGGNPLGNGRGFLVLHKRDGFWRAHVEDIGACGIPDWEA